jgi:Flp pilus assembly protein TadG
MHRPRPNSLFRLADRLRKNDRGNVAVIFALTLVPIVYCSGAAVDYVRLSRIQSGLQDRLDASALLVSSQQDTAKFTEKVAQLKTDIQTEYSGSGLKTVEITGSWISTVDYQISATATVDMYFMGGLAKLASLNTVGATVVARYAAPTYSYKNPEVAQLDPEAGDYNRMGVYCYDSSKKNTTSKGRSAITWIADNGGTKYTFTMPNCPANQTMSLVLKNVRSARTQPSKWDSTTAEQYWYYTDTVINLGVESYDLGGWSILETVLCNNLTECKAKSQGGVIPTGKNRTPERATAMCQPGKYMYYGWEDRPPGAGWTDTDYDDIRVIIECPAVIASGSKNVFLLR